jgi:replication fork protection complex subunit Csm3/Swi3
MPSPAPLTTGAPSAGGDEFDDIFNYDVGEEEDPFSENYKIPSKKPTVTETASKGKNGAGLGIDEEVEVTRKPRAPRVKLDENRYVPVITRFDYTDGNQRLISAAGIPKLRKRAKDHLKFKGKGHEVCSNAIHMIHIPNII